MLWSLGLDERVSLWAVQSASPCSGPWAATDDQAEANFPLLSPCLYESLEWAVLLAAMESPLASVESPLACQSDSSCSSILVMEGSWC